MSLAEACRVLTTVKHCGAEWSIAYNGLGPHAWGRTEGRCPDIALSAEDAIRLAAEHSKCESPSSPSP